MDEEYKQPDISKVVERLMDEEGYEFGEAVKEAMEMGYKDGGLMVAIQRFNQGGNVRDSRATTQDFTNALRNVSAGTTYQQQADAKRYARNEAQQELRAARQGGDVALDNFLKSAGLSNYRSTFTNSRPGTNRQGAFTGTYKMNMDSILDSLMNKKLQTTSYGGGSGGVGAPRQKSALELKIEENKRLFNEYTKNNPATIDPAAALGAKGLIQTGAQLNTPGSTSTSIPEPAYMNKDLLSQLTMLTPEEAYGGETFDTLSDLDQYNFAQAFTQLQPQLRDSSYVSPYGPPGDQQIFNRRYGIRDGGRVGMLSGGALKTVGSGIMKLFGKGDDVVDLAKQEEIFRSGNITTDFLENVDDKVIKKFITTRDTKGPGGYGMYDNFDDMPNGLKAAELISRIKTADGGINYEAAELFIGKKLKGDETVNELIKMVVTEKKADGGRVGLFMGGDPLTGQALSIYDSMKAYNFSDQEIANALSARGLSELGTSNTPETTSPNIINQQLQTGGGGGDNNFSPFNPDPNRIQSFTPAKNTEAPINSNLSVQGDYDIYGNKINETLNPLQSGIRSVKNTMASVLQNPVIQTIGAFTNPAFAAVKGVATLFKDKLPVNQRAITENIAGQQGIRVDDIGRIVNTGKYNDPNNVMAGYSLNQLSEKTFDSRIGNIGDTLQSKYGLSKAQVDGLVDGTLSEEEMKEVNKLGYNSTMGKTTNLIEQIRAIKQAKTNIMGVQKSGLDALQKELEQRAIAKANKISQKQAAGVQEAIGKERGNPGSADYGNPGGTSGAMTDANAGTYCFDPNTLIQMADGSTKEIKNIQLGDDTKGGEVTGVFQFKAADEIHDYKGVTVAGSHYVKEDDKFIMVKDSPLSVKIDKIPVVYSLDTTGRRIFINDIEFADYNGDGVAKNFLTNAGADLTGFDTEVLRQVEHRLI